MQEAYAHCEAVVRALDKDRYLATLFVPAPARQHVFAVYAFNAEVASIRERTRQPLAGELRLQWWRDALAGSAAGDVSGNPVAAALLHTIESHGLSNVLLEQLVDARGFDLYDDPMPTLAAFEGYVRKTTSSLFAVVSSLLDALSDASVHAAEHAGIAYGIVGLLRAFPLHASRGQIYLPLELLERSGARAEDIVSGRTTAELVEALRGLRALARERLKTAREQLQVLESTAQATFLPLALVDAYLDRMDRADYDPFRTPVEIPQWRRQWTLWRAARRIAR